MKKTDFDLEDFLPYLLNQAAEESSLAFQKYYKDNYAMLRTEWRVLFHIGRYVEITAKEICERARIHKTKVSRAVAALEQKRFITREIDPDDRRHEKLRLTKSGQTTFKDLSVAAMQFDVKVSEGLSEEEQTILRHCLKKIAKL